MTLACLLQHHVTYLTRLFSLPNITFPAPLPALGVVGTCSGLGWKSIHLKSGADWQQTLQAFLLLRFCAVLRCCIYRFCTAAYFAHQLRQNLLACARALFPS